MSEIAGQELSVVGMELVIPSVRSGNLFTALHGEILTTEPAVEPEVQLAMRMQMIARLVECIATGDIESAGWVFRLHAEIMRRFHRYVDE